MFLLKRKKPDIDEETIEKPIRRKRKKTEPTKPWGKLERVIVFIFLISAPIFSIFFFVHSKDTKIPKVLSDSISRTPPNTGELKTILERELQNLTGTYGIWIQSLDNSFSLGMNEKQEFEGASLFKLPLMIGYFEEIDKGKLDPNTKYTLKYSDGATGAGILATLPPGTAITYHDVVETMGKSSDNTAFQIMTNILEPNKEETVINEIGMTNTNFTNSKTTPYDIGLLFYKLNNTNLLSSNSKEELLNFLKKTDFENLIPSSLPNNIKVAHKYADINNSLNDAGIIYTNKPYVLVILSKDVNSDEAQIEFSKISKIVYDWTTK